MDPKKLREQVRAALAAKLAERKKHTDTISALRAQVAAGDAMVTDENIDIINYTNNIPLFIQRSLTPAKISNIELDHERKRAARGAEVTA